MSESITLKVTSAFLVGGEIARPGELVEVSTSEAKDLLSRGKAVPATEDDGQKSAAKVGVTAGASKDEDEGAGEESKPASKPASKPGRKAK